MSYDISLMINTSIEDKEVAEIGNYTYNCSKMFVIASECDKSLGDLHEMSCKDAEAIVAKAVENMQKAPAKYKAMNPENGWGSYETFLPFIEKLLREIRANPNGKIDVS